MKQRCVVILTALPLEYKAVRAYLEDIREEVHSQGTVYERGVFSSLHQVWDVVIGEIGMGGLNAAFEAERAIHQFEPDVVLFVGVAGGLKDVQRGDVVAATRVYGYEPGKVEATGFKSRPSIGSSSYRMEQRAKAEARKDDWLKRLTSPPSRPIPKPYVGPIVAGEKVIASTSSAMGQLLRENYSDALAVEMEGHGFLQATHANPQVESLIIRGISDLIDDKRQADAESGQQVAAEHASAFAFEILAKLDPQVLKASSATPSRFGAAFPDAWNVPRRHQFFFTGRDHLLKRLYDGFTLDSRASIIPPQAINGLGGIGKTQTAAEYAYHYRANYRVVIWVRAVTEAELITDFQSAARLLKCPEDRLHKRESLLQTMTDWFMTNTEWLLILDNADNIALIEPFLPKAARGHILLTTRTQATGAVAQQVELENLNPDDGALCILRRANLLPWNGRLRDTSGAKAAAAKTLSQLMDGLPLALEQAGAYIEETGSGVLRYLDLYQNQEYRPRIRNIQAGPVPGYPEAVAHAWTLSRSIVQHTNPAASEILRLCAFLGPDAIPEEIFTRGSTFLSPVLRRVATNPIAFNEAMRVLRQYSLINRDVDKERELPRLSMHRILQEVQQDEMGKKTQRLWAERAVRAVYHTLPYVEWSLMQPHAQVCLQLIERWQMTFDEAVQLRRQVEGKSDS
jgi:nucleoside phosphorylase